MMVRGKRIAKGGTITDKMGWYRIGGNHDLITTCHTNLWKGINKRIIERERDVGGATIANSSQAKLFRIPSNHRI